MFFPSLYKQSSLILYLCLALVRESLCRIPRCSGCTAMSLYAYGWSYTCRSAWCSAAFSLASATWGLVLIGRCWWVLWDQYRIPNEWHGSVFSPGLRCPLPGEGPISQHHTQHMSVPGLCMRSSSVLLGISSNSSWGIPVGDYTLWCCVCARRIWATCESICPDRLHCPLAAELCPRAGRTWWAGFLYWILS